MPRGRSVTGSWACFMLLGIALVLLSAARTGGCPVPGDADAPHFLNAKVEVRALRGAFRQEVRRWADGSLHPRWLGYALPQVSGERTICCSNHSPGHCGPCNLETHNAAVNVNSASETRGRDHLEGSPEMAVMLRAERGRIGKIRVFSVECAANAGGLEVLWLTGVSAADSVALLDSLVTGDRAGDEEHDSVSKQALAAIALHGDGAADRALASFVSPGRPEWLRREVAFWLGEARGAEGLRALQKMAHGDPSPPVREQVTFGFSVSKETGALAELIRMAHEDQSPGVRGQALFWLAQKSGNQAEAAITGAIQNDPDTEVRKKAVFALSQLPKDRGVPKLIEVAQSNRNPEVRKQAMFWLGQSEDPRALAFFEKVLSQ